MENSGTWEKPVLLPTLFRTQISGNKPFVMSQRAPRPVASTPPGRCLFKPSGSALFLSPSEHAEGPTNHLLQLQANRVFLYGAVNKGLIMSCFGDPILGWVASWVSLPLLAPRWKARTWLWHDTFKIVCKSLLQNSLTVVSLVYGLLEATLRRETVGFCSPTSSLVHKHQKHLRKCL